MNYSFHNCVGVCIQTECENLLHPLLEFLTRGDCCALSNGNTTYNETHRSGIIESGFFSVFTECYFLPDVFCCGMTRPISQNIHTGQTKTMCTFCVHSCQRGNFLWRNFSKAEMGISNPC